MLPLDATSTGRWRSFRVAIDGTRFLTNAAALLLAALVLGAFVLLWRPLALLFLAIVIAESLRPVVQRLERRIPRTLAIVSVYAFILLLGAGALWYLSPLMLEQAQDLVDRVPRLVEQGQEQLDELEVAPSQRDRLLDAAGSLVSGSVANLPALIASSVVDVLAVVFLSIYWLISSTATGRFFCSLLPPDRRDGVSSVVEEAGQMMGGYVRGVVIDALIVGALTTAGLWVIGFEYAVVAGLITAFGELFPVIGPVLAAVPIVAVAAVDSPRMAVMVLIFYVVIQQVEGQILTPVIMKRQTDVPEVLVLFSLVAGGAVAGFLGALVAIPLAAAARVVVVRGLAPAIQNRWRTPHSAR